MAGVHENVSLQLNGGPLGGTASFQRLTTEMRSYSTLATFGNALGPEPMALVVGLSARGRRAVRRPGTVLRVAGVLAGRRAVRRIRCAAMKSSRSRRGGICPNADQFQAQRSSFGNAYYTSTAELGLRVSQQLYFDAFYDAGNLWERPRDFDPTRLFRGAGFGASLVTPLGPLGVDLGYGFDRTDALGSQGSQVAGSFQVRSDLLIRSFSCVPCSARRRSRSCSRRWPASRGRRQAPIKIALRQHAGADGSRPGPRRGRAVC